MLSLHLLADANIPFVQTACQPFGHTRLLPGQEIRPESISGTDVLLVRSVTRVDEALLRGGRVRFVGSATIGTDHIDLDYLRREGIAFAHAPGSNAGSVVEYVLAALLAVYAEQALYTEQDGVLRNRTVGVVGCGHIGAALAARLPALGARVLRCDPPLAEAAEATGRAHAFVSLDAVLAEADVATLHPPLVRTGPHPTFHLIGAGELRAMRTNTLLVNASRGAVVDNAALREALAAGQIGGAVLDVWENEPTPDPELVALSDLATPHIAGYSFDGKVRGTAMLHDALAAWLGVPPGWTAETVLAEALPPVRTPDPNLAETAWLDALVRQAYDIRADDARMRDLLALPVAERAAAFHRLRKTYPRRRAWGRHRATGVPDAYHTAVAEGVGFAVE